MQSNPGILFLLIGIFFFTNSMLYDMGKLKEMGPGFFPLIVSILLIIISFILIFKNDR